MAIDRSLSRRQVLRYGVAGGALLATGGVTSPALARAAGRHHDDWQEATVAQLQGAMKARQLSATELVKWYLDRIEELNPLLGRGDRNEPGRREDRALARPASGEVVMGVARCMAFR